MTEPIDPRSVDPNAVPQRAADGPRAELRRRMRWSLRADVLRSAQQLGALLGRVEREAPSFRTRLRSAVETLQLLTGRLSVEPPQASDVGDPSYCDCAACKYLARSRGERRDRNSEDF